MRKLRIIIALVTILALVSFTGISLCEAKFESSSVKVGYVSLSEAVPQLTKKADDRIGAGLSNALKIVKNAESLDKVIGSLLSKSSDNSDGQNKQSVSGVGCEGSKVDTGGISILSVPLRVAGL
ncbi:MAG: hypothetical protein GX969_04800 [Firmicutes bacterium]|nr:hypothetical protein [Bacillota bacterium]